MEPRSAVDREAHADAATVLAAHAPRLLRRARRYSLCPDDAEDALQRSIEILIRYWETIDRRRLAAWMLTVISREAMAIRRERLRELSLEDCAGRPLAGAASEERGPAERAEEGERLRAVARLLGRLKPQERRALTLQALGYSYAEIQEITGWTHTKVNRCMAEGRARLRQLRPVL